MLSSASWITQEPKQEPFLLDQGSGSSRRSIFQAEHEEPLGYAFGMDQGVKALEAGAGTDAENNIVQRRSFDVKRMSLHDVFLYVPHGATARTTRNGCLCSSNANQSMIDWHSSCAGIPHGAVRKRQEVEDLSLVAELLLLCFFRQRAGRPRMYISFFQPERSKKRNGCRRQHRAATLSLHDAVFCVPHGATARTTRNG